MSKISFQIEIKRVLEILSNDIYDSPYALLRENIQNAYDAILMRKQFVAGVSEFEPRIDVTIAGKNISIQDNGIGMSNEVVRNNFWKAGSSGKNNELAQKAGVVGTFGIGAMANFGVCKTLSVVTHYASGNETIQTLANRESLSITEDCIEINVIQETREPGTTVSAILDDTVHLTDQGAINYLLPYVRFSTIPVLINGKNISQQDYKSIYGPKNNPDSLSTIVNVNQNGLAFELIIEVSNANVVSVQCKNISIDKRIIVGELVLTQGVNSVYGLRNYFGLAPVPISSFYGFGGVVNMSILHPTAGREALSRDSIELVSRMVHVIEAEVSAYISTVEQADTNSGFLNYINSNNRMDLAGNIKIEVRPGNERLELKKVSNNIDGKKVYYYSGRDPQTILSFGNENSYLLLLSQENPRRRIQNNFILSRSIEQVPDSARIIKIYERGELSIPEISLIIRIVNTIDEDYLIPETKVYYADISHQVPSMVEHKENVLLIYLSKNSVAVNQVIQAYETAYEVFGGLVKDFVRNQLYQKFASFVPSSTKQGADALHKILMRKRELYKYEFSDLGELESLLNDYVSGGIDFPEVLKQSATIMSTHAQSVGQNQIGTVEQEIPSIIESNASENIHNDEYTPVPPIMRTDTLTDKKILKTDKPYSHLNNFSLFLSLSDKIFRSQLDFFLEPHTTKVIWSMHKVVYIFTHASNKLSLYYDIELKEKIGDNSTGGKSIPTTTIVTNNKIFIPIVAELVPHFDINEGTKEFYVRYDIITDFNA
jgi:molecular chaperone HtpG